MKCKEETTEELRRNETPRDGNGGRKKEERKEKEHNMQWHLDLRI
jgi:hypothetical protein